MNKFFAFLAAVTEDVVEPTPMTLPSYEGAFTKMMLSVVALLVLVGLTLWVLKRLNHGRWRGLGSSKSIQILERKPLSPKSMLYLIEVEGKQFLLAESQLEVRSLCSLNEEKPSL